MSTWRRAFAAEARKLLTLPLAQAAVIGTCMGTVVMAWALAQSVPAGTDVTDVLRSSLPFVQAGALLTGIVPAAQEWTGAQARTSILAVPRRGVLLSAKTAAVTLVLTALAAAVVALTWATARAVADLGNGAVPGGFDPRLAVGAVLYLLLMGLLAHGVTLLLRGLVPALVTILVLVLLVPPLLAGLEHGRWLPSAAASQLYLAADTVLSPATGALVALAWVSVTVITGGVLVSRRDS